MALDPALAAEIAPCFVAEADGRRTDVVCLACTHYPLLKALIGGVVGREVTLISSAEETTRDVAEILRRRHGLARPGNVAAYEFYTTGADVAEFAQFGSRVLNMDLARAAHLDLPPLD